MKEIPLTQGKVAIVDDEDYETLAAHKWYAQRLGFTFYAARNVCTTSGERTIERMHRVVLSRKLGRALLRREEVDHEKGNGLDNRREKLRLATKAQNGRNCRRRVANPSSQYLGVYLDKCTGRWRVRIEVNGKNVHLGRYADETEAALVRERFIEAHPELMAKSNFNQSERAP